MQERLEAAAVQATTTAGRKKKMFMILDELRQMAPAAKCRNPVLRTVLRKRARRARRDFDARVVALPKGKTVQRPIVQRLWINGKASEERDGWMEEEEAHYEGC